MRKMLTFLLPGLLLAAAPASAAIYSTAFSGTAVSGGSGTVTGSFVYSSDSNQFLSFRIGSNTLSTPTTGYVTAVPSGSSNPTGVLFEAPQNGTPHFALDLEALSLSGFTTGNPLALLTTPNLIGLLDTNPGDTPFDSTFSYNPGPNGPVLTAVLTSISTSVPEPASLALLAAPVAAFAFRRRS